MLSLRCLARTVPRNTSRLTTTASRVARQSSRFQVAALKPAAPLRFSAAFSTTRPRFEGNEELTAKLESEIALERDQQQSEEYRAAITQYLDNSEFQLEDQPGQEEVFLTRTYGDEKIKVVFSIADYQTQDPDADGMEDPALYDEEDGAAEPPSSAQSGGANTKGAINQGRTSGGNFRVAPEDDIAPADRDELRSDEDSHDPSYPARVQVQVTREGKGAMEIECVVQDGEFAIDNIYYFPSAEMLEAKTAEASYSRRSVYTGPPFGQLDEDLQTLFDQYLLDRGINTAMAVFLQEYIDSKELAEYLRWLENMKKFVE